MGQRKGRRLKARLEKVRRVINSHLAVHYPYLCRERLVHIDFGQKRVNLVPANGFHGGSLTIVVNSNWLEKVEEEGISIVSGQMLCLGAVRLLPRDGCSDVWSATLLHADPVNAISTYIARMGPFVYHSPTPEGAVQICQARVLNALGVPPEPEPGYHENWERFL